MATNWHFMITQIANIKENGALTVEYLRSMLEKIKISNKIFIKQVEKIIGVSIKYINATRCSLTPP